MPTETHIVPSLPSPIRLQEYGVGIFFGASTKSALKKAIKKKMIKVNGVIASTATFINGGETISFNQIPKDPSTNKLVFRLDVLYEDDHLAIIHKPPGILVSGNSFKTIAKALMQNLCPSTLQDATWPQPVHRLDYATTGALLIGKTGSSIRLLNKMFEEKQVEKIYYAITIGSMEKEGAISLAIDGKESLSNYELIESVVSDRFGQLNLVKLCPQTGRRHQLRIHLASIGNPILGDKDYGIDHLILNGKGMYLHAYSLSFIHPYTKEKVFYKSNFPRRFKKIFDLDINS